MQNKKIIGIWGYPHPDILNEIKAKYPDHKIIDLDINFGYPKSDILPDASCRILKNIIDNAIYLKENIELIIASVGAEKCDGGRFVAKILKNLGFNVIQTKFTEYSDKKIILPISTSNLPLKDKICKIMDGILDPINIKPEKCKPTMGFWGVPPNDLSMLDLFPDTTHVFGWVRCVEAKRPADLDLEMFVDNSIPTVFFAQTFCAKTLLAKYLARKYDGLFIDVDDTASNSVKAKIEAFIRLG